MRSSPYTAYPSRSIVPTAPVAERFLPHISIAQSGFYL